MYERAKELRAIGRRSLSGNWLVAIIAAIIASLLGGMQGSISVNFKQERFRDQQGETEVSTFMQEIPPEVWAAFGMFLTIIGVLGIIWFLIGGAVQLGYNRFNIEMVSGYGARLGTVFSRFDILFRALWLRILTFVFTFLWMLLFIIPGIIASYRYAMAPYIMAENSEVPAREAISLSKKMMHGYKWRLFCLQLSFIGWILLSVLTCGIGMIWVAPYMQASQAAFYKKVSEAYYSGR